jgi:hypothetical protein
LPSIAKGQLDEAALKGLVDKAQATAQSALDKAK